jgi:hypothetical protein
MIAKQNTGVFNLLNPRGLAVQLCQQPATSKMHAVGSTLAQLPLETAVSSLIESFNGALQFMCHPYTDLVSILLL